MTRGRELVRQVTSVLDPLNGESSTPADLCAGCAALLNADGAAITLMGIDGQPSAFYASGDLYEHIEELQFTAGCGPATDAYSTGELVLVEDLALVPGRWFGLAGSIVAAGISFVLSLPLEVGSSRIGTLTYYGRLPGSLAAGDYELARAGADYVAHALLALQAGANGEALAVNLADSGSYQREVHQAAGMISVQLGVSVAIAIVRLRAWAFANNTSLAAAAELVVRGELRLESN